MNNNHIKIFVDCHVFDKGFQGTRTYIQGLYLELIKDNTKHFIFAANDIENLKSIFGDQKNLLYSKYYFKNSIVRLLIEIPYLIKKHKANFAHFQYRVAPLKLCKYIVTTHDVLFQDYPEYFPKLNRIQSYLTYKFSANIADIVFTVSEYSKERIEKHLDVKKTTVMPNGVDGSFYKEYNKKEIQTQIEKEFGVSNYLLCVSRWEPRKNQHLLLKLFINLNLFQNYFLVFIGDTTFTNEAFVTIYNDSSEKVKSKIVFLEKVEFETFQNLIRGAELSIYPSIAEGFGIPPLESIAAGTTSITSNATAMSDFDFLIDYSFDPRNEQQFERILLKAIQEKTMPFDAFKKTIKQKYNWSLSAAIYKDTINTFIDSLR